MARLYYLIFTQTKKNTHLGFIYLILRAGGPFMFFSFDLFFQLIVTFFTFWKQQKVDHFDKKCNFKMFQYDNN